MSSLFYEDKLIIKDIPLENVTTSELNFWISNKIVGPGLFEPNQKCKANFRVFEEIPIFELSEKDGIKFTAKLAIDISCLRNN